MHGTTRTRPAAPPVGANLSAVVWIEPGRAIIVRGSGTGEPASLELAVPPTPGATAPVFAEIAHRIGDVDRVLILGAEDLRTALEREIVAVGHRPEAIREETGAVRPDEAALIARFHRLA
jgi:hypothetical protein